MPTINTCVSYRFHVEFVQSPPTSCRTHQDFVPAKLLLCASSAVARYQSQIARALLLKSLSEYLYSCGGEYSKISTGLYFSASDCPVRRLRGLIRGKCHALDLTNMPKKAKTPSRGRCVPDPNGAVC